MNSLMVWIPPAPLCSAFQSQDCAASLPGKIIYVIASVWQILAILSWKLIISYFSLLSPLSRALHGKSSTSHPVMKDNFPTLAELTSFYNHRTLHIVARPRSFSYFIPLLLLLPISLLIPPSALSHTALRLLILPLSLSIQACTWICYSSFDVVSANGVLWSVALVGYYDVRRDFGARASVPTWEA